LRLKVSLLRRRRIDRLLRRTLLCMQLGYGGSVTPFCDEPSLAVRLLFV
jgi:hypothetical protein